MAWNIPRQWRETLQKVCYTVCVIFREQCDCRWISLVIRRRDHSASRMGFTIQDSKVYLSHAHLQQVQRIFFSRSISGLLRFVVQTVWKKLMSSMFRGSGEIWSSGIIKFTRIDKAWEGKHGSLRIYSKDMLAVACRLLNLIYIWGSQIVVCQWIPLVIELLDLIEVTK